MNSFIDHWTSVIGIAVAIIAAGSFTISEAMGAAVRGDADAMSLSRPLRWVGWVATVTLVVVVVARFLAAA